MTEITTSFLTSFLLAILIIPLIINIFKKKNLVDEPDKRKRHRVKTPSMGGIGIFISYLIAMFIWKPVEGYEAFKYLFGAMVIMFILGLRDDLVPLKPRYKLVAQIFAALLVVHLNQIHIDSFYGFLGIEDVHWAIGYFVSVVAIIVLTNSFNLIDGLDGLAGMISVVSLTAFGIWFYLVEETLTSLLIFTVVGAIIGFLNFNWSPAKIFMGDTGALLLGLFISTMMLLFLKVHDQLPRSSFFKFESEVAMAVAIIIMPIFDTSRIIISRWLRKKSPLKPDRTHIHHLLLRLGLGHSNTAKVMGGINILFILVAFAGRNFDDNIMVPVVIAVALLLSFILDQLIAQKYLRRKTQRRQQQQIARENSRRDSISAKIRLFF